MSFSQANFGYFLTSSNQISFDIALNRARQASAIAEDKGIAFCEWNSSSGKELERKIKIENNIQNELKNNKFFLDYQPVFDAKTKKMMGAEVLSRLNSENDGILTPGAFLSAVKNVGINEKFDYYIFDKNCKWISNDKEKRGKYIFTTNFSRATLSEVSFADKIIEIVEKYSLDYSCIAIEILEDINLSDEQTNAMINNLSALKEKGITVLLDDFGRGYTSFMDLTNFKIDIVKIDKSITQKAITETGFVILKNIIKTATDLGYKTLCEGIETQDHERVAIEAGCDFLQGYYYYRPMSVTKLEELFEN